LTIEKTSASFIGAKPVAASWSPAQSPGRVFLTCKRCLDFVVALALLLLLLPIGGLIYLMNFILNPGKLMYKQQRVGKDGVLFTIYKFRTMLGDCEETRFATEEEGRINPFGRFLRHTRLDELPQILNVLMGDMSLIGPRPEQVTFYQHYEQSISGYSRRQSVRPGISGLAQLKYGYTCDHVGTQRKLRWDVEYIERMGFGIESYIFWHTCVFVLLRLLGIRSKTPL
jgi:lipopolysaccharide/colanic/teichoic acid biosynthesis glycosyltransferase